MHYYDGAQRYEQFWQVGQLYRALILLSLALFRAPLCLQSSWCCICIIIFFCLHPSLYLLVSWAWWDWPLTWLTNHHPSVLWHCWLGHLTRKIVSEMTYNVSSGTLNTTISTPIHWLCTCVQERRRKTISFVCRQWEATMASKRRPKNSSSTMPELHASHIANFPNTITPRVSSPDRFHQLTSC